MSQRFASGASKLTTGWGRAPGSSARQRRPRSDEELECVIAEAVASGSPVLARGAGRAYGDAAQCAGGTLLYLTDLPGTLDLDEERGSLRVNAGVSLDDVLRHVVPRGWFLPVTPGTSSVTIGGAVAADVHGKNHHRDGTFARYVTSLTLINARGTMIVGPNCDPELFWATVGGMGLTGVIASVTMDLRRIETSWLSVDTLRTRNLDETMTQLTDADDGFCYSVAWVDGIARGRHLGRSVITRAQHAARASRDAPAPLAYRPRPALGVPMTTPVNVVTNGAVRLGNELFYRRAPLRRLGETQSLSKFFYPLDAVGNWNRLYGPRGFTQYQFVVPFNASAAVHEVLTRLQQAGIAPSLAVLKRFGPADPAPLSFPTPGWTLALDVALGDVELTHVLDELDELVVGAGGRVYLAKDGRLNPTHLETMYPRLLEWRATCRRVDPDEVFVSDLSRRLDLRGGPRS